MYMCWSLFLRISYIYTILKQNKMKTLKYINCPLWLSNIPSQHVREWRWSSAHSYILSLHWNEWFSFTIRPVYFRYPLDRRLSRLRASFVIMVRRNPCHYRESKHWIMTHAILKVMETHYSHVFFQSEITLRSQINILEIRFSPVICN
jgi:hypothetical protein